MSITPTVKAILGHYESDNPGTKANLARILMQGKLGGTGKLVILPVDQGFEHGPARSFAINPAAYDPHYHYQLAIDAGLSAYAAPLGMLEEGKDCREIVTQLTAIRTAVDRTVGTVIGSNLEHCIKEELEQGHSPDQVIKEAVELLVKSR